MLSFLTLPVWAIFRDIANNLAMYKGIKSFLS